MKGENPYYLFSFYLFILISACHHCHKSAHCSEEHNATLYLLIRYLFILYTFYCDMQIGIHTLKAIAAFNVRTFHIFDILLLDIYFLAPSGCQNVVLKCLMLPRTKTVLGTKLLMHILAFESFHEPKEDDIFLLHDLYLSQASFLHGNCPAFPHNHILTANILQLYVTHMHMIRYGKRRAVIPQIKSHHTAITHSRLLQTHSAV